MSRHRSASKRVPPEIGLYMECFEEDLEPSQVAYYTKTEKEFNEVQNKLDNYVKKMKAEVVEKGENCVVLQLSVTPNLVAGQISTASSGKTSRQSVQPTPNYQQMVSQGILSRSTANTAGNTYLVMDRRLGFMVGPMQSQNVSEQASAPLKTTSAARGRHTPASGTVMVTTRAKSSLKKQTSTSESEILTPPLTRTREKLKGQTQTQTSTSPQISSQVTQQIYSTPSTSSGSSNYRIRANAKQVAPPAKPNENNALGGLLVGSNIPWKQIADDGDQTGADSKEVTFSKITGKTFPSLVVVARPHLKVKFIPQSEASLERTALDAKVKGVLMYTSTKFTEWLIQQGLIRSEQTCQTHVNNDLSPVKLKLGMYSDVSKFPYSGGYVWISDCCPSQFVSVFFGSIFEGAPHPPTTLLKLIYHWACQTNIQNVVQWVQVDNFYVKSFFTNMRAVCTQAIHEKYAKIGGPRKKIEVGVISLGTTSQDGNRRQVKVEVLGVLDQESKLIRLRAVEPLPDERSFKRRFIKILEPLEEWVYKDSTILTDFTVPRAALNAMGFNSVIQVTSDSKYSNQNVMEYLRRIVPRMFQNTLSLLSRQIIQQFLDELVWRETWGCIPSQAFVNIVADIAEQTKLDATDNFLIRLNKVATNPFARWNYSVWKQAANNVNNTKNQEGLSSISLDLNSKTPLESCENLVSGKGIRTRKRTAEQSSLDSVTSSGSAKRVAKISVKDKTKKDDKIKLVEKNSKKDKETGEKFSEEIVNFINEGKQIILSSYYYGFKNGDENGEVYDTKEPFNVKCCVCNKRFTENIILMKHMILHHQTEPALSIDLKKVNQCDYCFLGFNTNSALKVHLEEVHFVSNGVQDLNLLCQICELKFDGRISFIYHMHRTHVELELPYECGVCNFRTSVYKIFVDHFIEIHGGGEHVFCPYCLKVVTFSHKGKAITKNVFFYMSHLEKHQRRSLIRNCNRCQLSFIHKGILDQHLEADHGSWKNETGVKPISGVCSDFLMPEPGTIIKPAPPAKSPKSPKTKNLFTSTKFKPLQISGLEDDMACLECEGSLIKSDHFTSVFNCAKCRYSTCCENAMVEHSTIFHETPVLQFTIGKPIVLGEEMFCVCGYSSSSGNRLAKHMAICERKSIYASRESAEAAIFSKTANNEAQENAKQGEGQNVLNMLGLVRKSPEVVASGTESVKKGSERETLEDIHVKEQVPKRKNGESNEDIGFQTCNLNIGQNTEQTPSSNNDNENETFDGKSEETIAKVPVEANVIQHSLNISSVSDNETAEQVTAKAKDEEDEENSSKNGSTLFEMKHHTDNCEKMEVDNNEEKKNSNIGEGEVAGKENESGAGSGASEQSQLNVFETEEIVKDIQLPVEEKKDIVSEENELDERKVDEIE